MSDYKGAERGAETGDVITCAAGCGAKALGVRELNPAEGGQVVGAPHGWGQIDAHQGDGSVLELFVCSRVCERRLANGLATPILGELNT